MDTQVNNQAGVRSFESNTLTVTKDTTDPTVDIYWDDPVTYTDQTSLSVTIVWYAPPRATEGCKHLRSCNPTF